MSRTWFIAAALATLAVGCSAAERDRQITERESPSAVQPRAETPAEDLKRDGVITPPETGDEAAVKVPPAEAVGRTPVIRPPGSPGGDPKVQPK